MDAIKVLMENNEYFTQSNFIWDLMRQIGWVLLKGFVNVCNACESFYTAMYKLVNFTEYDGFRSFVSTFRPLLIGIFAASLFAIGIMLIGGSRKHIEYIRNVLVAVAVITAVPLLFGKLNSIVIGGSEAVFEGVENNSLALVQGNIDDLIYMANQGVNSENQFNVTGNSISIPQILYLPYKEVADPGDARLPSGWDEVFKTAITKFDITTGAYISEKIESSFLGLFDAPYYYRYKIHYFIIYITLIALTIAYIFTAYKVVRIIWEISVGYLLSMLASADLTNGQRVIRILNIIKNNYIVLFLISVFLRLYAVAVQYIGQNDMGNNEKAFFVVCLSFCLIDGPNLVEKILGVDAGLSHGFGNFIALHTVARSAKNVMFGNGFNPNDHGIIGGAVNHIRSGIANHSAGGNSNAGSNLGSVVNNAGDASAGDFSSKDKDEQTEAQSADNSFQTVNSNDATVDISSGLDNENSQNSTAAHEQDMDISSDNPMNANMQNHMDGNVQEQSATMEGNISKSSEASARNNKENNMEVNSAKPDGINSVGNIAGYGGDGHGENKEMDISSSIGQDTNLGADGTGIFGNIGQDASLGTDGMDISGDADMTDSLGETGMDIAGGDVDMEDSLGVSGIDIAGDAGMEDSLGVSGIDIAGDAAMTDPLGASGIDIAGSVDITNRSGTVDQNKPLKAGNIDIGSNGNKAVPSRENIIETQTISTDGKHSSGIFSNIQKSETSVHTGNIDDKSVQSGNKKQRGDKHE